MTRFANLPILPSTVVGSHGKASWWFAGVRAHEQGVWGEGDLAEMLDDAADTAIRDMTKADLDVITDGEVRRLDGYVDSYYAIIKHIQPIEIKRKDGPWGYDQQTRYVATGKIDVPEGGLGIVDEFTYGLEHSDKPLKATCAGPLTFGSRIHPGDEYKGTVDVAERFCEVINDELKALVKAGAEFIQIDEPARGNVTGEEMGRLFNKATEGVNAKLAFHICFGNRYGRGRFQRVYSNYFPGVLAANADQFVLEFASREMFEVEKVGAWLGDRELGAGVVDVKSFYPETPADVARRVQKVLQYMKPEKVWLNPDCGFGWSPRYMCNQKITALAAGAKLAREQLGR
ncbi:MAG: methionine synthase [Chloroflexi bacterium]|nr:methionine synthase [Chloroflexota bacterium]